MNQYNCPCCVGTGSLESSDSTDDSWWDCSTCEGTGKLEDRRRGRSWILNVCPKCNYATAPVNAPVHEQGCSRPDCVQILVREEKKVTL